MMIIMEKSTKHTQDKRFLPTSVSVEGPVTGGRGTGWETFSSLFANIAGRKLRIGD